MRAISLFKTVRYVQINKDNLIKARELCGYSADELDQKICNKSGRYLKWESGEALPTWNQLNQLSFILYQPIDLFLSSSMPPDNKVIPQFRKIYMENYKSELTPEINIEIRKALDRREIYISLKQELEDEIHSFTSFYSPSKSPSHEGFIKQLLGFSSDYPFGFSNDYKLLKKLIQILEKKDILVFQTDKYGRNTIDVNKMRGFSIFFHEVPIIVINSSDAPSAKIFSLLHELCHLTLKENDISNSDINQESYCNKITANLMMPKEIIENFIKSYPILTLNEIKAIAKKQLVSQSALIWRIFNFNFISPEQKVDLYKALESSLKQLNPFGRQLSRSKRIITDLGQLYVSTVFLAYYNDKIDSSDLINIFHVGWDNIKQIENQL